MSSLIADGAVHGGREAAADVIEELQLPNVDHQGGESTAPVAVGRGVIGCYRFVGSQKPRRRLISDGT